MDWTEQTVVVTGAASGIGRGVAGYFAKRGARVVVADIDEKGVREVAAELEPAASSEPHVVAGVDVTSAASVDELFQRADDASFSGVVHCAGVQRRREFLELSEADWDHIVGINLKGSFLVGQAAARRLVARGSGAIVLISSIMAEQATADSVPYATSKGGVRLLTKAMATALGAHGVRVNAVGPGPIETAMTATMLEDPAERRRLLGRASLGRLGTADDIAAAAAYLLSDEAKWVTGTTVYVDGGILAHR